MDGTDRKKWAVFAIKERRGGIERQNAIFVRVGIAFLNRDGSYNIYLDATPIDGKLHMREWREEAVAGAGASSVQAPAQAEAF